MNEMSILKGFPFELLEKTILYGEGSGGSGGFPG